MTAVAQFTAVMAEQHEARIKRDRWGRYMIPHPETGEEQAWTRATTVAETQENRYGLELWDQRNVVLGMGRRPDLVLLAKSCTDDDKDQLNKVVTEAKQAAHQSSKANMGTAIHRFTERVDAGERDVDMGGVADEVAAYTRGLQTHGIDIIPAWTERILLVPDLMIAGTCDRLCNTMDWPLPRIGDLKTGKDVLQYGMGKIAQQLAIYANATHWWQPGMELPAPIDIQVDRERAVVFHVPAGRASDTKFYEVDIAVGWEAVQRSMAVRAFRDRKDLAQQMIPTAAVEEPAGQPIDPDALTWLHKRVEAIKAAGHRASLAAEWSRHPEIPTFPKGGPRTLHEFNLVDDMCDRVEAAHGMDFGPSNPTQPTATKATITKRD